jgi:hypothetical protein
MTPVTSRAKFDLANRILLDKNLIPAYRLVGWYIADHINTKRGYAWPPIAEDLGISVSSVKRDIKSLAPYFNIDRRGRANEYRIGVKLTPIDVDDTCQIDPSMVSNTTGIGVTSEPPSLEILLDPLSETVGRKKRKAKKEEIDEEGFEEFWKIKPNRGTSSNSTRRQTLKAYRAAVKAGNLPATINEAARKWAADESKRPERDRKYIQMASTWLNARSWEDAPAASPTTNGAVFRSYPGEAQFEEWHKYHIAAGNIGMVRELNNRRESGRGFDFESEWPPRPEPKLVVVGAA